MLELHHECFDDGRAERAWDGVAGFMVTLEGPCWPPPDDEKEPDVPPPGEMIESELLERCMQTDLLGERST